MLEWILGNPESTDPEGRWSQFPDCQSVVAESQDALTCDEISALSISGSYRQFLPVSAGIRSKPAKKSPKKSRA